MKRNGEEMERRGEGGGEGREGKGRWETSIIQLQHGTRKVRTRGGLERVG